VIIALSLLIEPIIARLQRRHKYRQYQYLEWVTNGTLQLQRLAFQGAQVEDGEWEGFEDTIPTSKTSGPLPDLTSAHRPQLVESEMKARGAEISSGNPPAEAEAADVKEAPKLLTPAIITVAASSESSDGTSSSSQASGAVLIQAGQNDGASDVPFLKGDMLQPTPGSSNAISIAGDQAVTEKEGELVAAAGKIQKTEPVAPSEVQPATD
jgi:hypothetical protein